MSEPDSRDTTDPFPPAGRFRLLEAYTETLDDGDVGGVRRQLSAALKAFPELHSYTVTVGRIPPSVEMRGDPIARARPYNRIIELPVGEPPSNMTLFHELAHLAIYQRYRDGDESVSRTSEDFTSLFALARMDPSQIYRDSVPYFGEPDAPADEWPEIAENALAYRRRNGKSSHYAKRAREWFSQRANGGGRP